MNCTHCNKPITLVPSATERAKKSGGNPSDYTRLFTAHSECQVKAWYKIPKPAPKAHVTIDYPEYNPSRTASYANKDTKSPRLRN